MTVLVCDDDPSSRFVLKRLLTQHLGCTVVECGDGVEAIARLEDRTIDLVLLDLEMPHMDGRSVLEVIRATPSLAGVPVVMVTSERRQDQVVPLLRLGVDGYVLKPLRAATLLTALAPIRDRLARRRQTASHIPEADGVWFGPDAPALLVDGSLDYRHFFQATAASYGPVVEAHSGAAAVEAFRETEPALVFVGSELGVFSPRLLVPKLRSIAGGRRLRVVGLGEAETAAHGVFDEVTSRSFVPDQLARVLRRLSTGRDG